MAWEFVKLDKIKTSKSMIQKYFGDSLGSKLSDLLEKGVNTGGEQKLN